MPARPVSDLVSSRPMRLVAAFVLTVLVGCSSAFSQAMDAGDRHAGLAEWDAARADYERAVSIDPTDGEAQRKLQKVRRRQAEQRHRWAEDWVLRGAVAEALAPLAEAIALDPTYMPARTRLVEVERDVLVNAESLAANGAMEDALTLVKRVLAITPQHPRALELQGNLQQRLAEVSYREGVASQDKGQWAHAALAYGKALAVVTPDTYQDAEARLAAVRGELVEDVRFVGVMAELSADPSMADIARSITPKSVASILPNRRTILLVDDKPANVGDNHGLRFGGHLEGYAFGRDQRSLERSCRYVCERRTVDNPEYQRARRRLEDAERKLPGATLEERRLKRELDRKVQRVTDLQNALAQAERDRERAEERLTHCLSKPVAAGASSADGCRTEQREVDRMRESVNRAREAIEQPERDAQQALSDFTRAKNNVSGVEQEIAKAREIVTATPPTIVEERSCDYGYLVDVYEVRGELAVRLAGRALNDDTVLIDEQAATKVRHIDRDETRGATSGRCPELEREDPLSIADEDEVRMQLRLRAIERIADAVRLQVDAQRRTWLSEAEQAQRGGHIAPAIEAWGRYLISSLDASQDTALPATQKAIAEASNTDLAVVQRVFSAP